MSPAEISIDFSERPYIVIWEVTQACDLACVHCRASAQPNRNPLELSTEEGKRLIDDIAQMQVPVFVLTGGDPIKRPDLFELIEHAKGGGARVSLTPSARSDWSEGAGCLCRTCCSQTVLYNRYRKGRRSSHNSTRPRPSAWKKMTSTT